MAPGKNIAEEETAHAYLLLCGDGTRCCGYTVGMERQLVAHRAEKGARYTRGHGLLILVYLERLPSKRAALRRGAALKRLPRSRKEALLQSPGNLAGGENGNHL